MDTNFAASLKLVRQSEGGNDDNPADHGGRTSRGITQKEYDAWCDEHRLPRLDVWRAPEPHINQIYHDEYWEPYCDLMPVGVDYIFFNNSVLDGPHAATLILQRSLGVVDDGRIGPITRQTVKSADPKILIPKISDASRAFYKSLHQPRFLHGWLNRVDFVEKNALGMLPKSVGV
jgi:lysozyme family protein